MKKEIVFAVVAFIGADAACARFLQADPIGMDGGINRFDYVGGDPLRKVDPFGLFEVEGYPSSVFDKRKYPAKVQELYRYAAVLQQLLKTACPGNKKAQELFDKWVGTISEKSAAPTTDYHKKKTEFTSLFFDEKSYSDGTTDALFVFMHEFMHLTDTNYAKGRETAVGEYINALMRAASNDLPVEKQADQLVRDLMKGKCPCE